MKFKRAIQIGTLSQAIQFGLSFLSVVVVSRLLQPEEIGIFSVAVSLIGFAHVFREFGVGQYLIQIAEVRREQFRAAFTVALGSAWLIGLVLLVVSQPVAALYGNQGIGEVLILSALNFAILPFGTPSLAMLRREMKFASLAWIAIIGAAVQAAVTIGAAWQGQSYLSMVWGTLAMTLVKMLLLVGLRPGEAFLLPTRHGVRDVLQFGALASGASIVTTAGGAAPDLILGKAQGFAEVALFSRATSIQLMLVDKINEIVRSVHLPVFAARVREGGSPAALFCDFSGQLAVITLPTLLFFAAVADPLIVFVFGTQWDRSTGLATVLCLGASLSAPMNLYANSLVATGHVRAYAQSAVLVQSVRVALLLSAFWWSLESVAIALVASYAVEALVAQWQLHRAYGLQVRQTLAFVWRPWVIGLATAAGPMLLKLPLAAGLLAPGGPMVFLLVAGVLGASAWLLAVHLTGHPIRQHVPLLRSR